MVKQNIRLNAVFLFYSNCFNESNVWTPPFSEKPCCEKHSSCVYVWSILSEIFENNPFKFVTNNGKGVEPRLWSSFTFHWIILCESIHILVYLLLEGKRSWTCFDACTFYPHITVTWVCGHAFQDKKTVKRNLLIKRKTNDFDT